MTARHSNVPPSLIIPTCYWWHDAETGEWIVIPGCMERAHDAKNCSCHIPESRIERERAKRRSAEDANERMLEKWRREIDERREMQLTVHYWRKVLRDHGIEPSDHNPPDSGRWWT